MALPGLYEIFKDKWGKQTTWIYSDTHFGDTDIPNRPSDEEQIKNINACAGRCDTLILLGDVGNVECVRKLRACHKVLIMGNHDRGASYYQRKVFKRVFDADKYSKEQAITLVKKIHPTWKVWANECYDFHSPFHKWEVYADNLLFDEVYEGALMVGEKLLFSHEPVDIPWVYNIHGHEHDPKYRTNHLNVCGEAVGFKPANLNQLLTRGLTSDVKTLHRYTIDNATERKRKKRV